MISPGDCGSAGGVRLTVGSERVQFILRSVLGCLLVAFLQGSWARGQTADGGSPDVSQIVVQLSQKNQDRAALLQHYEGCRHYLLRYTGFPSAKSADIVLEMRFDAPADKQFRIVREDGSRLLINRVLKELLASEKEALSEQNRRRTALTPANYDFRLIGTDTIDGRRQYVLEVAPRSKNKFLYRGKIWVDAADFAVSRISAEPAENPSFWISHTKIEHQYTKLGNFWLPAHNTSVSKVRFGGNAKLDVEYYNYRIGTPTTTGDAEACGSVPVVSEKR